MKQRTKKTLYLELLNFAVSIILLIIIIVMNNVESNKERIVDYDDSTIYVTEDDHYIFDISVKIFAANIPIILLQVVANLFQIEKEKSWKNIVSIFITIISGIILTILTILNIEDLFSCSLNVIENISLIIMLIFSIGIIGFIVNKIFAILMLKNEEELENEDNKEMPKE